MTSARNGAAEAAPARAVTWYELPFDEAIPKFAPACADGDEVLVRTTSGRELLCTVDRRRGVYFVDADGDAVEASAIAHPPRASRRSLPESALRDKYDTIKLRLPRGDKRRLEALAETEGVSAAKLVATWIDGAERENAALAERRKR